MSNPVRVMLLASLVSCTQVPTAAEAGISYSTEVSVWPASTTCLNSPAGTAIAKEVLVGKLRTIVIAGGDKAISDEKWSSYTPSLGNTKNSDRHLLFTTSCFARSPSRPFECVGEGCREIVNLDGYTWVGLSKVEAADCVPSAANCVGTTAKDGGLLFVITRKCHELQFEGDVIFLNGPHGEKAIMHATADGNPTTDVVLPDGWSLTRETLTAPLLVHPFGGGHECFYNIIRDAKLQSYHQLVYAGATYP